MHAITIAARNYLAMARTVAESFAAANPDDRFTILLVDAEPGEVAGTEAYDIATPADLSIPADEFGRMAFLYDVTELSTALKPWGLEMLLDRGAEVAMRGGERAVGHTPSILEHMVDFRSFGAV